jgi:hypothetical protein
MKWATSNISNLFTKQSNTIIAILFALLSTQVQANELLDKCDFNKDGKIYIWKEVRLLKKEAKKDWIITSKEQDLIDLAKKENKCRLKFKGIQLDKDIEQSKKNIEQLDKIIKLLNKTKKR